MKFAGNRKTIALAVAYDDYLERHKCDGLIELTIGNLGVAQNVILLALEQLCVITLAITSLRRANRSIILSSQAP